MKMENEGTFIIKARGLPWSATAQEVVKFFSDVNILNGENGVYFTFTKEGRPSGEAFIEVASEAERDTALAHQNQHMGKRYIEIKEAKHSEMEWVVNRMQTGEETSSSGENVLRLRGLPYGCTRQDIDSFFSGLQISPYGITLTVDQNGRASGDAYVEFATVEDAEAAMGKHKEKIGHRYIEIFRSSRADIKNVVGQSRGDQFGNNKPFMNSRPGPYDRPPNFGPGRRGGRGGGSNLGPSGFNSAPGNYGGNYDNGRSGRGGPMRGGRGGNFGGMNNRPQAQPSKTGHSVHMRGLPFEATTNDVMQFFAPLNPVDIRFIHDPVTGRVKGECDVDFSSHNDAEAAMQKDKQNMGHRYIELFLKSMPGTGGSGMGGGGGGWSNNTNDNMGGNMNRGGGGGMAPLMNNNSGQSYGGGYGGGYGGNQGNNQGGGFNNMGGNQGFNNTAGPGANYSGGFGGGPNTGMAAGGSGGNDYKGVSYSNIQGNTGGNYYGNMR